MKKSLRTALLALLLAALLLGGATALVYASAGDYPDALGLDPEVTEKITGEYLLTAAAAEPDSLIVFGSSELKTTDICTHPANFFAEKRCGFQVDLVGRGSCQSLVHALSIAGSGEALRGKKVVLITAPQSYVEGGIAPDLFMANFSGQQALRMLADDTIPDEIKQYLSSRVQQLMAQYGAEYGAAPEAYTAAGLLTKAVAAENALTQAFLRPYAAVSRWLLDTRDAATAAGIMRAYSDVKAAVPQEIDWDAELEAALSQAQQMATNNDFFMLDGYYSTYIGRKLSQLEGRDADLSYAVSPEEPQPPAQSDEQPASELQLPVTDEPETPQEDTFTPPFDGTSELLADGRMMLTYDEKQLKLTTDGEGFYSLVSLDGAASARMDLQQLPALLSELENDELERLCIGILQAYYYLAPETQSITLTDGVRTADGYTCTLGAPAYEDAPAVTAKVRLMQLDKQLWYAIVLTPEGADGAAVLQAFDNLTLR